VANIIKNNVIKFHKKTKDLITFNLDLLHNKFVKLR